MDKKTKILGIAPYEGMKSLMMRLADLRKDIELTVFVGDMEVGAEIASKHTLEDYDIILSRGGTAELITATSPIPVVEIQLSVYDILRAIKLAENYSDPYAIVGFPGITKNARLLCDLLQYDIDIYTIHNLTEVYETLARLNEKGYRMVLCDAITHTQASQLDMRSILFTSGAESIEAAYNQAVKTAETQQGLISKSEFFRTLLEDYPYFVFVYDEKGNLIYVSKDHSLSPSILTAMKNYIPDILIEKQKKFYRDEGGVLIAIKGFKKFIHKQTYVAYYVNTRKVPLSLIKNGIRYLGKEQALEQFYNSYCYFTNPDTSLQLSLEQISLSSEPVIILGEGGTGKGQTANFIYAKSELHNKPMAIIDCSKITEKGWTFLTEHSNSPFSDTDTTIYIREIEFLSDVQFRELLSIIRDLNLCKRNRLIFSYTSAAQESMPTRCGLLANHFACIAYTVLPLRSCPSEIPGIAKLYISNLNMELAKEVAGLEPEALLLLQNYSWPGNYRQLKRILKELVLMTDTPYIKTASVSRLLLREQPSSAAAPEAFNLNRTLEEINLDIVCRVLAEEGGNQSAAANRLGIGRSTLWRMLRKLSEHKEP